MIAIGQGPASESIREVLREVFASPEYQWDIRRSLLAAVRESLLRAVRALDGLHTAHPMAYYVLVGILIGALIAILAHFTYIVWRVLRPGPGGQPETEPQAATPRDASWYRREALRSSREARFSEALGYRFRALILTLDGRRALRFHPSKTPAEYLGEARLEKEEHGSFAGMVTTLYRHLFGGAPCTKRDVVHFDELATGLESQVAPR